MRLLQTARSNRDSQGSDLEKAQESLVPAAQIRAASLSATYPSGKANGKKE
jgi:hypothetical protein